MPVDQETAARQAQRFANLNNSEIIYWNEATPTAMITVKPRIVRKVNVK